MSAARATNRNRLAMWLAEDLHRAGISSSESERLSDERWEAIAESLPTPPDEITRRMATNSLRERETLAASDIFKRFEGE